MAEYYRTVFTVEEGARGLELLRKVEDEARRWAGHEFGKPLDGVRGELEGTEGRLRFGTRSLDDSGVSWLVWEHPDEDAEIQWRLGLRLATEGDDMEADIEVRGLEGEDAKFQARPPDIVSILFTNFHCALDGKRLTTKARRVPLTQEAGFRGELFDPQRSAPLLTVSEETMDADFLQRQLLGLVTVISYDRDAAWQISKNLPRPLRCYDGAIRLYSPNCSETDVSQQHPYWLPSDVTTLGRERMCRILRDECVNRLPRHGRRRLFSRVRDEIRRKEMKDLESKLEQQALDDDTLLSLLTDEEVVDERDGISSSRYNALAKVARSFKNKADILADELKGFKDSDQSPQSYSLTSDSIPLQPSVDASDKAELQFANILEVVRWAGRELDGLHFFPSAFESAEPVAKSGQFKRTDKLCHVFEVMNECARKRRGGSIGRLTQWFKDRQVTYARGESKSTNERHPDTRLYGDLRMEEHFKLRDDSGGRFELRIYVSWDEKEYQWLIGHVGEHEPTSTDPH